MFRDIDFFDSSLKHNNSDFKHFNEISNFLRNFEHCQHLYRYRKTHLFLFLFNCFNDSIFKWFQKQSHFDFLHIFSTVLANVFSFQQQRKKARIRKRTNQKIAKNVVKNAKSTSKFQNIDIFDSTSCNESKFELYNEIANFLQNFQQRQHQYRKSNLLNLLSKCFCDFAFEWFKFQSEFTSLKRFNTILTKTFFFAKTFSRRVSSKRLNFQLNALDIVSKSIENTSNFEITNVRVICKLCKQNFNFNNELYEHIRDHEILKFVENSHFSIDTINLICEIEKKSLVSQKSHESFTKFQKSIFEFAITFKAIILLKRSTFQFFALETTSKFTKKLSTCRHCDEIFNFKKSFRKHKSEQHSKKHVKNFRFENNAIKLLCAIEKKSIVMNSFVSFELQIVITTLKQISESTLIFKIIILQENIHLSIHSLEIVSESKENESIQCFFTSQKSSILFATSRNLITNAIIFLQFVSSNCSNLSIATLNITSKCTKNTSKIAKIAEIFAKSIANIRIQIVRIRIKMKIERTIFQISTLEFASKSMKKFSIKQIVCARICKRCKQNFNFNNKFHEHIREHHVRKLVQNLNFRTFASESTCKIKKKSTFICSFFSFVSQKSFIFFATSRSQIFFAKIVSRFVSSSNSNFSIATHKITSKLMKIASINDFFISFATFSSMFRKSISKSHFTIDDLFRMFRENFKSFDLRQHHNRRFSQQNFDIRQFRSIKSHLIIENLIEMFDEKVEKNDLFQNQMKFFSRAFFSDRSQITIYFKFTINQKSSIDQNSKNSKSKNLNQHMFAKSIRIVFNKRLFEKSFNLSYKIFNVFCINLKSFVEISFFIFIFLRFFSIFFLFLQSFRSCQLQQWIALTFTNKLFRSLIVSFNKNHICHFETKLKRDEK